MHALKDEWFISKFPTYVQTGNPTLITDKLKAVLERQGMDLNKPNIFVLPVKNYPPSLLSTPPSGLDMQRMALLKPLGWSFSAPVNVSLFPFTDGSYVVENFADNAVDVVLNGENIHHW